MTVPRKTRIRLIALALGVLALLVPMTVSTGGVEPNNACANGSCCFEPGSVCESSGGVMLDYAPNPKGCPDVDR